MNTAEKIGGHVGGYLMVTAGTLMAILGGVSFVKMVANKDPDTKTMQQAVGFFAVGTLLMYAGNRVMPATVVTAKETKTVIVKEQPENNK